MPSGLAHCQTEQQPVASGRAPLGRTVRSAFACRSPRFESVPQPPQQRADPSGGDQAPRQHGQEATVETGFLHRHAHGDKRKPNRQAEPMRARPDRACLKKARRPPEKGHAGAHQGDGKAGEEGLHYNDGRQLHLGRRRDAGHRKAQEQRGQAVATRNAGQGRHPSQHADRAQESGSEFRSAHAQSGKPGHQQLLAAQPEHADLVDDEPGHHQGKQPQRAAGEQHGVAELLLRTQGCHRMQGPSGQAFGVGREAGGKPRKQLLQGIAHTLEGCSHRQGDIAQAVLRLSQQRQCVADVSKQAVLQARIHHVHHSPALARQFQQGTRLQLQAGVNADRVACGRCARTRRHQPKPVGANHLVAPPFDQLPLNNGRDPFHLRQRPAAPFSAQIEVVGHGGVRLLGDVGDAAQVRGGAGAELVADRQPQQVGGHRRGDPQGDAEPGGQRGPRRSRKKPDEAAQQQLH